MPPGNACPPPMDAFLTHLPCVFPTQVRTRLPEDCQQQPSHPNASNSPMLPGNPCPPPIDAFLTRVASVGSNAPEKAVSNNPSSPNVSSSPMPPGNPCPAAVSNPFPPKRVQLTYAAWECFPAAHTPISHAFTHACSFRKFERV